MWLFETGIPAGNTVTTDAFYPTGLSKWGSGFNPADVIVTPWGSMTLTYTDCNNLMFSYNSTIPGFGSATRSYTRLSTLKDVECPM